MMDTDILETSKERPICLYDFAVDSKPTAYTICIYSNFFDKSRGFTT